ncbi:MAG: hypothetical protein CL677_10740 [Bdellovibrionaceae bacterium]|nr:hypothetical protein [Pseudobdellovibrionaceae bacterium]|tara:strand:+ start:29801 stop:30430 length:630 start_codon:yes stop_codon:yes gene_type:complete
MTATQRLAFFVEALQPSSMTEFMDQNFTTDSDLNLNQLENTEFEGCKFIDLDFEELSLRSSKFIDCEFIKCSLSQVKLVNTTFREVRFESCRLMGVNWSDAQSLVDGKFESCKLDYSIFQGMDLRGSSFLDCSAKDVDFSTTNLSGTAFTGTLLENANFHRSDLRNADLRNATRYFIDPNYTKLKGLKVDFPEASSFLVALGLDVDFNY